MFITFFIFIRSTVRDSKKMATNHCINPFSSDYSNEPLKSFAASTISITILFHRSLCSLSCRYRKWHLTYLSYPFSSFRIHLRQGLFSLDFAAIITFFIRYLCVHPFRSFTSCILFLQERMRNYEIFIYFNPAIQ